MKGFKRTFGPTLLIAGGSYICFFAFALAVEEIVESVWFIDSTTELHAIAALIALLLGGVLYFMNQLTFRAFVPHLTVSHEVADRLAVRNRVHVSVNILLENTSRVDVNVRSGKYFIQKMAPPSKCRVGLLFTILCGCNNHKGIKWGVPEQCPQTWQQGELILEPGQKKSVLHEFEVAKSCRAVKIYTSFDTPNTSGDPGYAKKWEHTSVYDISSTN